MSDKDAFLRIKYMGYCMSEMPPDEAEPGYEDFLKYAKFILCQAYHKPMKDPFWDKYSDEEILVEYFAILFDKDKEAKAAFEDQLRGLEGGDDFADWADQMIADNQETLGSGKGLEDKIDFTPDSIGD